jgi:Carbohydrate family 9 binding domain-like
MLRFPGVRFLVLTAACVAMGPLVLADRPAHIDEVASGAAPEAVSSRQVAETAVLDKGSEQTYLVRWVPGAKIVLDGRADEPVWSSAVVETGFFFPWKKAPAPATEFRALCDETHLYFSFRVRDDDIVALERLRDEQEAVLEDRVEVYLGRDEQMKDYFCLEVDSKGRVFDYRSSYPRLFKPGWKLEGLETGAAALPNAYQVECRIPVKAIEALGFPALRPGVKIRCGLYRAEFSHDRSGRQAEQQPSIHTMGLKLDGPPPIEEWLSWVDPKTKEPDFHVPSSMGWLEISLPSP